MARKPKPTAPITVADLAVAVERIATGPAGTSEVRIDLAGTSEKLVTDRIRRLPRLKGWNALAVKRTALDGTIATLAITSAGQQAIAWPTKQVEPKPAAKPAAKTITQARGQDHEPSPSPRRRSHPSAPAQPPSPRPSGRPSAAHSTSARARAQPRAPTDRWGLCCVWARPCDRASALAWLVMLRAGRAGSIAPAAQQRRSTGP